MTRVTTARALAVDAGHALAIISRLRMNGDCLDWIGARQSNGYGVIKLPEGLVLVHRAVWALAHRQAVPAGWHVLHRCGRPPCANPAHLYLGTPVENADDARRHGTLRRGSQVHGARLTETRVMAARAMAAAGVPLSLIAQANNVNRATISQAVNGQTWAWIQRDETCNGRPADDTTPPGHRVLAKGNPGRPDAQRIPTTRRTT